MENEKRKVAVTQSRSNELAPVRKKMRWKLTGRKKSVEIRTRMEEDKHQQVSLNLNIFVFILFYYILYFYLLLFTG